MSLHPPNRDPSLAEIRAKRPSARNLREHIVHALAELGGQATSTSIIAYLDGHNQPTKRQVAAHLSTRKDVGQQTTRTGATRWILDPEVA